MNADKIIQFFSQKLTLEEKLLCLVPIIGFYIDLCVTFIATGTSTRLLVLEYNTGLKTAVESGPVDLFIFVAIASIIIFLAFTFIMYLSKYAKLNILFMYALVFTYFGLRINGALSWVY